MKRSQVFSKSCAREGCDVPIVTTSASTFARQKYHNRACDIAARREAGSFFGGHVITAESRIKGGKLGAAVRLKKATQRAAAEIAELVPPKVREELDRVQEGYLLAALARAWRAGRQRGRKTAWQAQRRERTA